jgi:hypothetical protein
VKKTTVNESFSELAIPFTVPMTIDFNPNGSVVVVRRYYDGTTTIQTARFEDSKWRMRTDKCTPTN